MKNFIPIKLNAAIGGYFGPSCRIKWDGEGLLYLYNPSAHAGEPGTEKTLIDVNESDWENFRTVLDEINVWDWQERYENPDILDGTSWGLEAVYPDRSIVSSGSNSTPGNFGRFLEAVRVLVKGNTFE